MTKDLLLKYHLGKCTAEEKKEVEDWFASDFLDLPTPSFPVQHTDDLEKEIWNSIQKEVKAKPKLKSLYKYSVAAAVLLCCLLLVWKSKNQNDPVNIWADNLQSSQSLAVDQDNLHMILSSNSFAQLNDETGNFKVMGDVMLIPKKDLTIRLSATHTKRLKKGESYFLMGDAKKQIPVLIARHELIFLSPLLQKHILNQFQVS